MDPMDWLEDEYEQTWGDPLTFLKADPYAPFPMLILETINLSELIVAYDRFDGEGLPVVVRERVEA